MSIAKKSLINDILLNDTICAPCTQLGGAIAVIRISGPCAILSVDGIFKSVKNIPLKERKTHTISFGKIYTLTNEIVDEVVVSLFKGPYSYTGEDIVEISCHGSRYIVHTILEMLLSNGCRMAEPGEFTRRAFLNGKMDLSQAEAVADLISCDSAASHRIAMNQMRGLFSKQLKTLRDQLLHLTSLVELELDFSDHEELEFANRSELKKIADEVYSVISKLVDSFRLGNALKNGIPVAIIGQTNAGKSTLLNRLLGDDRAIVSDVHGTTRDVIEDTINISGITFRFIDTAGIRCTSDPVESMGIEKSFQKIDQAEIILWVIAEEQSNTPLVVQEILEAVTDKRVVLLFNKSDLLSDTSRATLSEEYEKIDAERLYISAKSGEGIAELEKLLIEIADLPKYSSDDIVINNIRHYEALQNAQSSIERVQRGLEFGISNDFVSQDLRECVHHLSDIVGEVSTDSVLQNIFKNFCIGK